MSGSEAEEGLVGPLLAAGVELLGPIQGTAYPANRWLIRVSGSQYIQSTELLYHVLSHADGQTPVEEIARRVVAETGRDLSTDDVRWLLANRLVPSRLIVLSDVRSLDASPATETAGREAPSEPASTATSQPDRLPSRQAQVLGIKHRLPPRSYGATAPLTAVLKNLLADRGRWNLALRAAVALVAIVLAYHYSLATLLRALSLENPLAYLGLVPVISIMLIAAHGIAPHREPNIHDRELDYIVGIPLLLVAVAVVLVVPSRLSVFFWLWRLDLLSLPLFAAGAFTLIFGVRAMWQQRLAIVFLVLAWPLPYALLVNDWLQTVTGVTIAGLTRALQMIPVAQPINGVDGSLFFVGHQGQSFIVTVVASCGGVNGMVAFLVVGLAFASLVRGPVLSKAAWLMSGIGLIWCLNLARIILVLMVGQRWGESVAIHTLDPYLGLIAFSLGVLAMILALRLFGLTIGAPPLTERTVRHAGPGPSVSTGPVPSRGLAVQRARLALAVVLIAGAVAGIANIGMRQFELVAYDLGAPRVQPFSEANARLDGWSLTETDNLPRVRRYFGEGADWIRYTYIRRPDLPHASSYDSTLPVTVDVISTSDLRTFSAHGLEVSYPLHTYRVVEARRVDLAGGVIGHAVIYQQSQGTDWLAVYWEWPVRTSRGQLYERVILNMATLGEPEPTAPPLRVSLPKALQLAIGDLLGGKQGTPADERLAPNLNFLIGFAQQVVLSLATHSTAAETPKRPELSQATLAYLPPAPALRAKATRGLDRLPNIEVPHVASR